MSLKAYSNMTMRIHDWKELRGKHAFASPSQHSWLGLFAKFRKGDFSKDDLRRAIQDRYASARAKEIGTELHELAERSIAKRIEVPKSRDAIRYMLRMELGPEKVFFIDNETIDTFRAYVNDSIHFSMISEVPLKSSEYAFGTSDAIYFDDKTLKIFDLKTGKSPVPWDQLYIYAAFYCSDYSVDPSDIDIELRIYQYGKFVTEKPDPKIIRQIMEDTKFLTEVIDDIKPERR